MKFVTLNDGNQMPILGLGVLAMSEEDCEQCVLDAIDAGYRLIDTAQGYGNERAVGRAIQKSAVAREELFITTKLWIAGFGYEKAKAAIQGSLERLQLDYIDLFLIHHPFNDYYGAYQALVEFQKAGKIKSIGVSNFYEAEVVDFVKHQEVIPAVNQLEMHPFHQRVALRDLMKKSNIAPQAWSPFAQGRNDFFENEVLKEIGAKHNKSVAQVALRFLVQQGISVVPKTVSKERMIENIAVFDFELSAEEMATIAALDTKKTLIFDHYNPADVERLINMERKF